MFKKKLLLAFPLLFILTGCSSWGSENTLDVIVLKIHSMIFTSLNSILVNLSAENISSDLASGLTDFVKSLINGNNNGTGMLTAIAEVVFALSIGYILIKAGLRLYKFYFEVEGGGVTPFSFFKQVFSAILFAVAAPTIIFSLFIVSIQVGSSIGSTIAGTNKDICKYSDDSACIRLSDYYDDSSKFGFDMTTKCIGNSGDISELSPNPITNGLEIDRLEPGTDMYNKYCVCKSGNVTREVRDKNNSITDTFTVYEWDGISDISRVGERMQNCGDVRERWILKFYYNLGHSDSYIRYTSNNSSSTINANYSKLAYFVSPIAGIAFSIVIIFASVKAIYQLIGLSLFIWKFCGDMVMDEPGSSGSSITTLIKKAFKPCLSMIFYFTMMGIFVYLSSSKDMNIILVVLSQVAIVVITWAGPSILSEYIEKGAFF